MTERFFDTRRDYKQFVGPSRAALSRVVGVAAMAHDPDHAHEAVLGLLPETDAGVVASILDSGIGHHSTTAVTPEQKLYFAMGAAAHALATEQLVSE